MRREHAIGEQVAELVLRPSVHDAMNDLVQVCAWIDVVGDARRDNRKNVRSALSAVIEPCEKLIFSSMRRSA